MKRIKNLILICLYFLEASHKAHLKETLSVAKLLVSDASQPSARASIEGPKGHETLVGIILLSGIYVKICVSNESILLHEERPIN